MLKKYAYKIIIRSVFILFVSTILCGFYNFEKTVVLATNNTIYNVQPTTITPSSITIGWQTTSAQTSKIEYGATSSYGSSQTSGTLTNTHSITITGLRPHTTYHYRVGDVSGAVVSDDYTVNTDVYMGLIKSSVSEEVDNTQLTSEYNMGIRYKTLELAWDRYETNNNFWNTTYIEEKLAEYEAYRDAGFSVVLDFGMQYPGNWVKSLDSNTYFVSQYGDSYQPGEPGKQIANLVFNKTVRDALGVYIQKVFDDFGTDFYAVRLGGLIYGELHYPEENYNSKTNAFWAYDSNAQGTTNNRPTGVNANPVPGWIPNPVANGTFENGDDGKWAIGGTSSIVSDAHRGTKALKMSNPGSFINQTVQDVRVVAGRTYRYSLWAKTNNPSVGACLQIRTTSDAEMVAPVCTTATSFTQITGTFTPSENIARMALLTNDAASGLELIFDDVEILDSGYSYDATHANATAFWDWYVASLTNFQTWQVDQLDTAGFSNNIFVLYPGWGIRTQATVNQVTDPITYDLSYTTHPSLTGETQTGNDWETHLNALPNRSTIFPYATWMERTADEANSNKKEWSPAKYLAYLASNLGFNYWGENAGQENASELLDAFSNITAQGYYGFLWFSEQELFGGTYASASNLSSSIAATDTVAPYNGELSINAGAATTASLSATLTIAATDNYTKTSSLEMQISENSDFSGSSYESYNNSKNWTLSSGYGTKTVYIRFKDLQGRVSTAIQDSIEYPAPVTTTSSTSSSESTTIAQPPGCSVPPPGAKAPHLYAALPLSSTTILLYFSPGDKPFNHYSLAFGTKSGIYEYGIPIFGGEQSRTVLVDNLHAQTSYYFKVRTGNDCATGPWSNEKSAKTWQSSWISERWTRTLNLGKTEKEQTLRVNTITSPKLEAEVDAKKTEPSTTPEPSTINNPEKKSTEFAMKTNFFEPIARKFKQFFSWFLK